MNQSTTQEASNRNEQVSIIGAILYSEQVQSGRFSLRKALAKKGVADTKAVVESLRQQIEMSIYNGCEHHAVAMFDLMQKTDEWPQAGKDRVYAAFMRSILHLPAEQETSFRDYQKFDEEIARLRTIHGLDELSVDALRAKITNIHFDVLGKKFNSVETRAINRQLEIVGSRKRFMGGSSGGQKSLIYGLARSRRIGPYHVHFMDAEEMHSPNQTNYLVGLIIGEDVVIRRQVCEYVLHMKWMPELAGDPWFGCGSAPENVIADSMRKQFLALIGATSKKELLARKNHFLDLMTENLLHHEVAHDAMRKNLSNLEVAVAIGLDYHRDSTIHIVAEVMTELQPGNGTVMGPIAHIVQTALRDGDPLLARQQLWLYLCDAWFYDTDTTFMYPYSDLLFALLLPYLEPAGEVDFAGLGRDLPALYGELLVWYREMLDDAHGKLLGLTYEEEGVTKTYDDLKASVTGMLNFLRKYGEHPPLTDPLDIERNYWINLFGQVQRRCPDVIESIERHIESHAADLHRRVLDRLGNTHGDTLRAAILEGMMLRGYGNGLEINPDCNAILL